MNQQNRETFLKLYQHYRYEHQLSFYVNRHQEFTRAQTQALVFSMGHGNYLSTAFLRELLLPQIQRTVTDAQITSNLRSRLAAALYQLDGFFFEFFRVDLLNLFHE